jgi:hypothetical protein
MPANGISFASYLHMEQFPHADSHPNPMLVIRHLSQKAALEPDHQFNLKINLEKKALADEPQDGYPSDFSVASLIQIYVPLSNNLLC